MRTQTTCCCGDDDGEVTSRIGSVNHCHPSSTLVERGAAVAPLVDYHHSTHSPYYFLLNEDEPLSQVLSESAP